MMTQRIQNIRNEEPQSNYCENRDHFSINHKLTRTGLISKIGSPQCLSLEIQWTLWIGKKKHRKTVHGSTTACTLRSIPTKKLQILSIIQTIPLLPPCFSSQKHLAKTMVKTQRNKIVIDCSLLHARAIVHVRNTLWMGLVETLQSKIVVFQDLS